MQNLFDLTGRVAVITGSTKGMGLEMARALGASGAALVVSGRDQAASQAVAAALRARASRPRASLAISATWRACRRLPGKRWMPTAAWMRWC